MHRMRWLAVAGTALAGIAFAGMAGATTINMDFDQLGKNQYVNQYYDGGCSTKTNGNDGKCNGPTDGISWYGAKVVKSGSNKLVDVSSATMSSAGGFNQLVFDYDFAGALFGVSFYSGTGGSGTLISQALLGVGGFCYPGTVLDCHADISLPFVAKSAVFGTFLAYASLDNMSVVEAPEPGVLGVFGAGLVLLGAGVAWRRRATDPARQAG